MTEEPNFFKLGLFLLLAAVLLVAGLLLFSSGVFAKKKTFYETYFDDSVHGLGRGSPVLLNGVQIGIVDQVNFVLSTYALPEDTQGVSKYDQYIRVVFYVLQDKLPRQQNYNRLQIYLRRGLRLRLSANLITGQACLEGVFLDPQRYPIMKVPWTPEYTYVPSAPSAFRTMQESMDRILQKLEKVDVAQIVNNTNRLLTSANQAVVDANVREISDRTVELLGSADQAVADAQISVLSNQAAALLAELRESNRDLKALLENPDMPKKLDNLAILIDRFNRTVAHIDDLVQTQTPDIEQLIENIRQVSENLNYLSERLKDNPSQVLFSQPPPNPEKETKP